MTYQGLSASALGSYLPQGNHLLAFQLLPQSPQHISLVEQPNISTAIENVPWSTLPTGKGRCGVCSSPNLGGSIMR